MSTLPLPLTRPLVSIGIPTYNRPQQLQRALRSIVAQTYPNFEVIVSDNCSPDAETDVVVERFMRQDARIRYVKQPSNIGMFHNFKVVFELANGEYFTWLADDDTRDCTFLERCLEVFERPHQSPNLLLVNAYSQLIPPLRQQDATSTPVFVGTQGTNGKWDADDRRNADSKQRADAKTYRPQPSSAYRAPPSSRGPAMVQKTDQGCTTVGLPPSERYYQYLSSIYTTQSAIGDLIHGVMKREQVQKLLTTQKNILGWDRVFLSALALEGEFYTIPEVLMYSSPDGMSNLKNPKKMAKIQGIHNPLYIWKAKWVRMFFLQQLAWCSQKLTLITKFRLSLWLWIDMVARTFSKHAGK